MSNKDNIIYLLPTDTCYWMACPIHDLKAYSWIYKIKKRDLNKPLAILVPDFKWLIENTDLTIEQVEFLKNYENPFTILTESDHLKLWINYVDDENNEFLNRDMYESFAFRVANNDTEKRLLKENWPMFLTSANLSGKPEMYSAREVETEFAYYLEKNNMQFVWKNTWNLKATKPSEIFKFIWESLEIDFIRK